MVLNCVLVFKGIYFVVDFLDFISIMFQLVVVGDEYYCIVCVVQFILQCYKELQDIIVILGFDELLEDDCCIVDCVCKVEKFFFQFFFVVEIFIGMFGKYVKLEEIIVGFNQIFFGELDSFFEVVFYLVGNIEEVKVKVEKIVVEIK